MKKIIITGLMMMSLAALIVGCSSNEKDSGEASKDETITFGVTPWTSTVPPTKIAVLILEDMGYKVEETKTDVGGVFMGLSRGDVDVFMDAWLPMHQVHLDKFKGSVEDTAVSYPEAKTGWVVPTYMKDVNKISDLKGKEAEFNNEMLGIEEGASATKESDEIIKAYDLNMNQVNSSEGGMIAEAARLMSQEKPVVFYGWRPHTMFNKYDLKVLENDQGFFGASSVHVITNKDLKENAPEAYEFLSNWNISIDEVEKMIVEIEENGKDPEKVAREWIENNPDKVKKMKGE